MHKKAHAHFKKSDPILYGYCLRVTLEPPVAHHADLFTELCDCIVSQQLSGRAASTIFGRFLDLFPKRKVTVPYLLTISDETLRACGTSWAKVRSLKDLAAKVATKKLDLKRLDTLPDDQVMAQLVQVKGIGPWTAEMFMMFALGREDIFSYGDLGLKNAIKKIYGYKKDPTPKQLEKIVSRWKPYRTHAARILWKSLDL